MREEYNILDPKVDFIFKQIFGQDNPTCRRLLLSLLNAILERKGSETIKTIEYVNPYLDREYSDDKQSILDIRVKTNRNKEIDIEMQVASAPYYVKRSLWYWASIYEKQLEKNQSYGTLNKCIVVNLINFNLEILKDCTDYHNVFEVKERFTNRKLTDDLEIHYVEMKKLSDENVESLDTLDKWTIFFNDANERRKAPIIEKLRMEMEEIDMAAEILERVSNDDRARAKYDSRLRWILDKNTVLYEADRIKKEAEAMNKESEAMIKESEAMIKEAETKSKEAEEKSKEAEEKSKEAEEKSKEAEERSKEAEERSKEAEVKIKGFMEKSIIALKGSKTASEISDIFNISVEEVEKTLKEN